MHKTTEATVPGARLQVEEGFVGIAEAATFLKLSRSKVYLLMDGGELPYAKFGKARRIPKRALREFAERSMVVR
jgi:excisionase family DNA binding protein